MESKLGEASGEIEKIQTPDERGWEGEDGKWQTQQFSVTKLPGKQF